MAYRQQGIDTIHTKNAHVTMPSEILPKKSDIESLHINPTMRTIKANVGKTVIRPNGKRMMAINRIANIARSIW